MMIALRMILIAMTAFVVASQNNLRGSGPVVNDVIVGVDEDTGRVYTDTESHRTFNNGVNDQQYKKMHPKKKPPCNNH